MYNLELMSYLVFFYHIVIFKWRNKSNQIIKNNHIYLTNRFQFAVRLFSNSSQATSNCGKNEQVAGAVGKCITEKFLSGGVLPYMGL